jgi:ferredoxin-NADP reductase
MFIPQQIAATVIGIASLTATIKKFTFQHTAAHYPQKPGQWLDLWPNPEQQALIGGYTLINLENNQGILEIAVKAAPNHPATRYLHEKLQLGDRVLVSPAQGHFVLQETEKHSFFAAGIGITPIIAMLRALAKANTPKQVQVFYSQPAPEEAPFYQEIQTLCLTHAWQFYPFWSLRGARFTLEAAEANLIENSAIYVCGPMSFVEMLVEGLPKRGIAENRLFYEQWQRGHNKTQ